MILLKNIYFLRVFYNILSMTVNKKVTIFDYTHELN